MNIKRIYAVAMVAACLAATSEAQAQTRMEKAVIATGGGHTQNAANGLDYTMGQEVAGMARSATTTGQFGFWSASVTAPLSVDPNTGAGAVTALAVSPNPVSDQSQVNVNLATGGAVQVTLYDMTGKAARVLFAGNRPAGSFSVPLDARGLASGTYFVAVSLPGSLLERPLTVVR